MELSQALSQMLTRAIVEENTALHRAVYQGNLEASKAALDAAMAVDPAPESRKEAANRTRLNGRGITALHLAAARDQLDICQWLIVEEARVAVARKSRGDKTRCTGRIRRGRNLRALGSCHLSR